jgi:hypothetical protein
MKNFRGEGKGGNEGKIKERDRNSLTGESVNLKWHKNVTESTVKSKR